MESLQTIIATAIVIIVLLILVLIFYYLQPGLWIRSKLSGAPLSYTELVRMRWNNAPVRQITEAVILLSRNNIPVDNKKLQLHAEKGGNVEKVAQGLVLAKQSQVPLSLEQAMMADLKNLDLKDLIKYAESKK
jgi:uncharacterized protein YqfA (UPF0365 family)